MFKNYLKIAFRNLRWHKTFSLINISGLAVGMACFILITMWVQDELNYDRFHENGNEIYRVLIERKEGGFSTTTPHPLAAALKRDIPEILNVVRFAWVEKSVMKYQDRDKERIFYEDDVLGVDPSIFGIFSFPLILGDSARALADPNNIVISESIAKKYFGTENPLDQTIEFNGEMKKVTGVLKDIPANSHLDFDILLPAGVVKHINMENNQWNRWWYRTYVILPKGMNPDIVTEKIAPLLTKYRPPENDDYKLCLYPLTKLHLYEPDEKGLIRYVIIFSVIAIFVLLLACINYINLTTSRVSIREKEVGLKRMFGMTRVQLIKYFLFESIFLTFIAYLLAMFLVELLLPAYNSIIDKNLTINYLSLGYISGALFLILFTGLLSGIIPAIWLSALEPLRIIRGFFKTGPKGFSLRRGLVVFQFATSITLSLCLIIIFQQLFYMKNADLGFDKENVIEIKVTNEMDKKIQSLKNELSSHSDIRHVSITGHTNRGASLDWEGMPDDKKEYGITYIMVDPDYLNTFNISLIHGRNFTSSISHCGNKSYIINEKAVEEWQIEAPLGKMLDVAGCKGRIIGVTKNAFFGFKNKIDPHVLYVSPLLNWDRISAIYIKIEGYNLAETISFIESKWKQFNPDTPFEFSFLDHEIDRQYKFEIRLSRIISLFSFIAIMVSLLGLLGLVLSMTERRIKEIGIRKVLGASATNVVTLLTKEFAKWVIFANFIAWPIAWYSMHQWLQNFPYRIQIEWWIFALSSGFTLFIALVTMSWQAIRAATANPVESLRYE